MEPYRRPGSPYWWVDFTDPATRKRRRVSTKQQSKKDAQRAALDIWTQAQQAAERLQNGKAPTTLGEAVDEYVEHLAASKKASARNTARVAVKLLGRGGEPYAGRYYLDPRKPLHELVAADLGRLVGFRQREGNGAQTIAHELKLIRAATRHAGGLGKLVPTELTHSTANNPWRLPRIARKTRYLSVEEFSDVYAYLEPGRKIVGRAGTEYLLCAEQRSQRATARDLLVALALCGGRWSEVASLTWDRIDRDGLLAWAGWRGHREGERPLVTIRLWGNKDEEERVIGAPDQVCEVLWRRSVDRTGVSPYVFPGRYGGRVSVCRAISRAMNAVGLNREDIVAVHGRATIHSLRHTYASWLLQNGADLAEVQDALGHTTPTMTRRYAHLAKRKTASKLGAILSGLAVGSSALRAEPSEGPEAFTSGPSAARGEAA